MKKLIALISAIAVMGTMSLTSFAEITVASNTEVTGTSLAKGATSGYDASYTSDKVNTQTTIVAVKGTEITTSSIQYINQLEQDSEETINFDLKDTLAADEIVTVYMGGDAIDKTKIGTITCAADAPTKYTVTFKVGDTANPTEYNEGADIVVPANPTKEADEEFTYEFVGWYVEGDETQTVVDLTGAKATATVTYVAKFDPTPIQSGGSEFTLTFLNADGTTFATTTTVSGAVQLPATEPTKAKSGAKQYGFVGWYVDETLTTKIADATISSNTNIYPKFVQIAVYGDANADGNANATDLALIKQKVVKGAAYTGTVGTPYDCCITSKNKTAVRGDANGDGNANATDLALIKQKVVKGAAYTGTVGTLMTVVKD